MRMRRASLCACVHVCVRACVRACVRHAQASATLSVRGARGGAVLNAVWMGAGDCRSAGLLVTLQSSRAARSALGPWAAGACWPGKAGLIGRSHDMVMTETEWGNQTGWRVDGAREKGGN
eukprot:6178428-Pleurochrysis_carterae.AAC.4